jgi:hypothetical protein
MKKIIASAGLVAVSSAGIQAAAPVSPMEAAKPWSISATLRAFYDDNNLSLPTSSDPEESFGFEARPAVGLNLYPSEQTYFGAAYIYSLRWYEARESNSADHSHDLVLRGDHRFSERYSVDFNNSFVYAQEPDVIDEGQIITDPGGRRTDADAFRNRAAINFDIQLTELLGLGLGYRNGWYDYDQEGGILVLGPPDFVIPSRSGLLDRFEHDFYVEAAWTMREHLTGVFGYNYGVFDYTSTEVIAVTPAGLVRGDDRDNTSHSVYVGADYSLSEQLTGSIRVGGEYTDYDRGDSDLSPWVDLTGTYTYLPGSFVTVGFRHARNATDVVDPSGNDITLDQETSALFASLRHRITPRLEGSVIGQYQRSSFNGGGRDGDIDNFLLLGANLEYRINPHWSTEVGYNFDRLDSDIAGRSFTRNRIYAGVRATY